MQLYVNVVHWHVLMSMHCVYGLLGNARDSGIMRLSMCITSNILLNWTKCTQFSNLSIIYLFHK